VTPGYDLAIVGAGFGGSLLALVARRIGLTVLLVDRGAHPRFAIGESTSPLTNLLLEEIAHRYDLPRLLPLATYGAWKRTYPEIRCGLKRGFTFYGHRAGEPFVSAPHRANQLLVAASPHDESADTHWLRSDVDAFLVREAVDAGADYCEGTHLFLPMWTSDGARLTGICAGQPFQARAKFVVDATGPRGYLSRALGLGELRYPAYPATQALYTHFLGVARCGEMDGLRPDGTPPYPPDQAAVHHVFEGGWMWILRFDHGVVSAGFAVTDALAGALRLGEGAAAWERFLRRFPTIGAQFAAATPILPFVHAPRLSYRGTVATGPGWALLPSSAAFVDPLFSTGFPLALLGIERLGRIFAESWGTVEMAERLAEYSAETLREADATADLIGACYAAMGDFPTFADLSMYYFAAASYSEMARRLHRSHLAPGFLLSGQATFSAALRAAASGARRGAGADREAFRRQVVAGVDPVNVAGLCDPAKENWYGVDLEDVVRAAWKLHMTPAEMREVIATAEWAR
jgi:FADH2 O2-dependent halogenase